MKREKGKGKKEREKGKGKGKRAKGVIIGISCRAPGFPKRSKKKLGLCWLGQDEQKMGTQGPRTKWEIYLRNPYMGPRDHGSGQPNSGEKSRLVGICYVMGKMARATFYWFS